MARLEAIPFDENSPPVEDVFSNGPLSVGTVLVHTAEEQSLLSRLPSAAVDQLADALQTLLDAINDPQSESVFAWGLYLARVDVRFDSGGDDQGTGDLPVRNDPMPIGDR